MINLFISILKDPTAISTPSSMDVIDMAAGHFAYLDHSTDSVFSFSLVRNLAQWARQAVVEAATRMNSGPDEDHPYTDLDVLLPIQEVFAASLSNVSRDKSFSCITKLGTDKRLRLGWHGSE
jgi:hypothetical protein